VLGLTGVDKLIKIYPSTAAALADPGAGVAVDEAAPSAPGQAGSEGRASQPG